MKIIALCITAALLTLPLTSNATTLNLAIDLSGSNPLLAHENFAHAASNYIAERIGQLKSADVVRVQTFGARNDPANMLDVTYTISRRKSPEAIADVVAQYIRALPTRKDISQGATEILGWIELHPGFNCEQGGQILILSDGIESSATVKAQALVEGKASLPQPDVSLKGCSLTFYGLGAGLPTSMAKHIRAAWQTWAQKAGAEFQAIAR